MVDLTGVPDGHLGPSLELRADPGISDGTWKEGSVRFTFLDPFMCAEIGLLERMSMARGEHVGYR